MNLAPDDRAAWERHADAAAELEAKGDEQQWAAAEEYERAHQEASLRQIAERVGKSHMHIQYMLGALVNHGLQPDLTFAECYRNVKRPRERPEPGHPPPLPDGVFDVLLADPPWRYDFSETDSRKVENQYPTMEVEEIAALEVPAASDAVLFLWATAPKLREALHVMEAWGFEYRTHLVWVKDKIGMGYYARSRHELLLVGRRGDPGVPPESERPDSVFEGPRLAHSRKPDVAYDLIETMYPDRTYLELFARTGREDWTTWGNE